MAKTYLEELMVTLEPQKELASLLKLKIELLKDEVCNNDLNYVNNKIDLIKTKSELFTLEKVIKEKEEYFKKYAAQFELDYKEANRNYKQVLEKVKIKAKTDNVVKSLLDKVNFQAIDSNKEVKVAFYKRFKGLL
jgi:hypothetical protein